LGFPGAVMLEEPGWFHAWHLIECSSHILTFFGDKTIAGVADDKFLV